jgi:hypothetical protein
MKPQLEPLMEVSATLDPPIVVGATPAGLRRVVPITGGTFEGARLRGTVLGGGADWQIVRADGVATIEAQYLLRTEDGVLIEVRNRGLRHGPEEVMRRLAAGEDVDPASYYFRAVPAFTAPAGPYEWLNRSIFLCSGARYASTVKLWFYRVT